MWFVARHRIGRYRSAGVFAVVRPCGIIFSLRELYGTESISQVVCILMALCTLVGRAPKVLGYDDACHLHKFIHLPRRAAKYASRWRSHAQVRRNWWRRHLGARAEPSVDKENTSGRHHRNVRLDWFLKTSARVFITDVYTSHSLPPEGEAVRRYELRNEWKGRSVQNWTLNPEPCPVEGYTGRGFRGSCSIQSARIIRSESQSRFCRICNLRPFGSDLSNIPKFRIFRPFDISKNYVISKTVWRVCRVCRSKFFFRYLKKITSFQKRSGGSVGSVRK